VPDDSQNPTEGVETRSQNITSTSILTDDILLSINPVASCGGVLVEVEPPRCPKNKSIEHVPCDIVLVIDVSYSMFDAAPVVGFDKKGQVTREHPGFSVLDIAKHAALTVLETLDGSDRLGIVKFSDQAEVSYYFASLLSGIDLGSLKSS
jgi:hypothetical protein